MLEVFLGRGQQGHRTSAFPDSEPSMPDRFRGLPVLDASRCADGCSACVEACPTGAISAAGRLRLDLGRCLFCPDCGQACPEGAIAFTTDYRRAARTLEAFVVPGPHEYPRAAALEDKVRRLLCRSLKLLVVSAGDCIACGADGNGPGT